MITLYYIVRFHSITGLRNDDQVSYRTRPINKEPGSIACIHTLSNLATFLLTVRAMKPGWPFGGHVYYETWQWIPNLTVTVGKIGPQQFTTYIFCDVHFIYKVNT
jgi:hypothetical protein